MFTLGPLQTKWLKLLRSGDYKQNTDGYLHKVELDSEGGQVHSFCCLGVAAKDVLGIEGKPSSHHFLYGKTAGGLRYFRSLGLNSTMGHFVTRNNSLAYMNDSGKTFAEIADFIESNPELVFEESK